MKNTPKIIYKNKEELYRWVSVIFEHIQENEESMCTDYCLWTIAIVYKNGAGFIFDMEECYFRKDLFINYYKKHSCEDIKFIVINSDWGDIDEKWFISDSKLRIDVNHRHNVFKVLRNYIHEGHCLNYVRKDNPCYVEYFN